MAWSAPMTAVAGAAFTAAQFNQYVRDNLNETAPGKASAEGQHFIATGVNAIAARLCLGATVDTSQTTTAGSYGDLATVGPSVTVTTGTRALIWYQCFMQNTTSGGACAASFTISGATTAAAADNDGIRFEARAVSDFTRQGVGKLVEGLTPGSNTFTMKYKISGGTGTFANRHIFALPL